LALSPEEARRVIPAAIALCQTEWSALPPPQLFDPKDTPSERNVWSQTSGLLVSRQTIMGALGAIVWAHCMSKSVSSYQSPLLLLQELAPLPT
jgi:hypothetical protein